MGVKRKPGDPPHWSGEWAKIDYYTGPFTPMARWCVAGLLSLVVLAVAMMLAMRNYGR